MLSELTIENFGLVEKAHLQFHSGFNVITGETGAGKSMLLNALKLLTGGRSDTRMVRAECPKAVVEAVWSVSPELAKKLDPDELMFEDSELFVSRYIQDDGKSRLAIAGRLMPLGAVSELSSELVEIHGQSDQLKLKDTDVQRELLDAFGGSTLALKKVSYREKYGAWVELKRRLKEIQENVGKREIELRYNQDLVKRFDELSPEDDELENTEKEIQKLAHLEDISEGIREVLGLILPEDVDSPFSILSQAVSSLWKLSRYDSRLESIADGLDSGLKTLEPSISELENYAGEIDLDSLGQLRQLEDRLIELKIFAKPFGGDLNRAIQESLKAQEFLKGYEEELDMESLELELTRLHKLLVEAASELTEERVKAGKLMAKAVNEELSGLAMRGTEFVVQLTEKTPGSHGAELIEFMVETKGANRRPITKAASGGELSRIMLALELVTAADSAPGTIIFDEIDSGVGGATAIEIGKRLAKLSATHQVIVVSHLSQVASWAQKHYVISKDEQGLKTEVHEVSDDSRVKEIARMLSGLSDSDTALAHAEELLKASTLIEG